MLGNLSKATGIVSQGGGHFIWFSTPDLRWANLGIKQNTGLQTGKGERGAAELTDLTLFPEHSLMLFATARPWTVVT